MNAGVKIACACMGIVRGRIEDASADMVMLDGVGLARALDHSIKLSWACEKRIARLMQAHNLSLAKLWELVEDDSIIAQLAEGDVEEAEIRVLLECKHVLGLGVEVVRLCEKIVVVGCLQLGALENGGGGGARELGKSLTTVLLGADVESKGIGMAAMMAVRGGKGGAGDGLGEGEFVKKVTRVIREKAAEQ